MIKHVTAKLAGMRKPQEFTVYPRTPGSTERVKVQSDKAIGVFDPETGEGLLNWRGSGSKYNVHLNPALGAEPYTFPADFVAQCIDAAPKEGDVIGKIGTCSVIIGPTQ